MVKHDGCPIGTRRYGKSCINEKLPMIGTYLVPSVENRAGCNYVKGTWVDPGVCLLQDPLDTPEEYGLTAPIKGMYIWWGTDQINSKGKRGPGEYRYYINGSLLADSPEYPIVMGGGMPIIEIESYEEDAPSADAVLNAVRDDVLTMAKNIMDGTEEYWEYGVAQYHTPDGKPTTHHDRNAVYSPGVGDSVKRCYDDVDKRPLDAFKFRLKGKRKHGRSPLRTFEIDPKGPPTEAWLPHKNIQRHKEGWGYN